MEEMETDINQQDDRFTTVEAKVAENSNDIDGNLFMNSRAVLCLMIIKKYLVTLFPFN